MLPYFTIGPIQIPAYGSVIVIAYIIAICFTVGRGKIYGIGKDYVFFATLYSAIGLLIGAKLLYALSLTPGLIRNFDKFVDYGNPAAVISYMFSGFVFYGGLIGVLITLILFCKIYKYDFFSMVNVITPAIPFIHSIGRIGCFLGGCCYGIEYHGPFSIHFHENPFIAALDDVPRFPVQLLESAINMILFIVLFAYGRKPRKPGSILGIYLIVYAIERFLLEFLRGDVERGVFFGVSTSQWVSLILLPIGIWLILRKVRIKETP